MKRYRHRVAGAFALLLAATTLAGCGCGPFGLSWCGRHGGYGGGGYGGGYRGGPGWH